MQHVPCSPFVEAWQHGKLTLGFSGGGFLLPYHLGVYQSLAAMGIVSSATPMAGSSAGSLVGAAAC
jgi:predicted acylesterase/phospholipase RssA